MSASLPARSPVWSPDGTHILFVGLEGATECDWYVAPFDGGPAVKTGISAIFHNRGIYGTEMTYPHPEVWTRDGSAVLFSAKIGDSTELWKASISPKDWKVTGEPQRIVSGPGMYRYPSKSGSASSIVFSSLSRNADIWSVPVDRNHVAGREIKQLTNNAADDLSPSISADGRRLVFESTRSGKRLVWAKDLEHDKERALSETPSSENFPIISPDGTRVVYQVDTAERRNANGLYVVGFEGGSSIQVCDDSCYIPLQWSSDNTRIFYTSNKEDFGVLDIRTGTRTTLLQDVDCTFWAKALAPNEKWISLDTRCRSEQQGRRFIVPARDGRVYPKNAWIAGIGGRWSPDAHSIYSISDEDGFDCLYVQRSDRVTQGPIGRPQVLHHFHNARRALMKGAEYRGGAVARDKIVVTLVELTGNIWMAEEMKR